MPLDTYTSFDCTPPPLLYGVLRDSMLAGQHANGVREVFGAKIAAADRLKDATRAQPLDGAVMFSSVAALMGSAGQTNYAVGYIGAKSKISCHRVASEWDRMWIFVSNINPNILKP